MTTTAKKNRKHNIAIRIFSVFLALILVAGSLATLVQLF